MKRIVNILSYLWLLLLMLVVACSDLEEIVINMQGEEEVELTIQTNVPALGGSTRTAPTENITQITALAFAKDDDDYKLIKVVTEDVVQSTNDATSGTYTVTVPLRTRRIHFIAKNADVFDTFSTVTDYGKGEDELLKDLTTTELHYWGKLDFNDATALKAGGDVTLIRNMAKLVLDTESTEDYIAGLLNYNVKGTIVPYKDGVLGYQTATNHDLPSDFEIASDETERTDKGKVHYMFEEFNDISSETTDLVYAICNIDDKFYKIAFKSGDSYYYIIRNQLYTIKIAGTLDTKLGKDSYTDAVQNGSPINDTTKEQVHIEFEPDGETTFAITDNEVSMYLRETGKVKVIIPEGITELQIGYSTEYFNAGGLSVKTTDGEAVSTTKATETRENIYIDTYDVTNLREIELSISLKESIKDAINDMQIQFIGSGELKQSNDKLIVDVLKRDDLTVTPTTVQLKKSAGSEFTVSVTIPSFDNFTGNFELQVTDVNDKFTISPEPQEGKYTVEEGSTTTFTFTLKADGNVDDVYTINFDAISQFHHLTGTTTVTLIDDAVPDQDTYEIWVGDGSAWTGTTNSVEFFRYTGTNFNTGTSSNLGSTFYDTSADDHISQAMVMGSDDSFTFTIPEGSNRWLTLLVASDGSGNTPSISLQKDGEAWTTTATADAATVEATYNFGNGEIGTAGRLIRYELPAGTYTLKGSDAADYLLYYMRVSTTKPTMTDIAQPTADDYSLSWSGGQYAKTEGKGYLKISDSKHIVDEDNLTHTVALKDENSLKTSINLSTSTLSSIDLDVETTRVTFTNENENTYSSSKTTQNFNNVADSYQLTTYNAGAYTLSGTIDNPTYKYSAFYDKLQLKSVEYEVKNPIKPGLYNSMNGSVLTPVDGFTNLDEAWAIGFLMPSVVPDLVVSPEHYKIDINIPDWTMSTDGDARGLGVIENSTGNYTLGTQDNADGQTMIHPRQGWTYKIKWAEIHTSNEIKPKLTGTDTDHYFTYKGTIDKQVSIPTPYTETALDIELDFYADVNANSTIENRDNNVYEDLLLGTSRFYLKATISLEDATKYNNAIVNLTGSYETNSIHWVNSRVSSNNNNNITYIEDNGTGLKFTITAGVTEYLIEWVFVTGSYYGGGDIGFTYNISNGQGYTLTGDTSAQIAFTNESQILVATNGSTASNSIELSLEYGDNSVEEFTVDVPVPTNVSGINIAASDFAVSIGKVATRDQEYPDAAVEVNGNYTFTDSDKTTDPRFKFKLNGTPANNQSVITFTSAYGNATPATVTVNWIPRGTETNQTTIWSGAMDLQWTQNYLETTTKQLAAGTQVTLNFTTTTGGQIKLHDSDGNQIASENIQGITYDSNNGVSVGSGVTQLSFTLQTAVSGLKINGDNVRMTSIVVSTATASTENVVIEKNFEDGNTINGWGTTNEETGETNVSRRVDTDENGNKYLVLVNTNGGFAQSAVDASEIGLEIYETGDYIVSFDLKGSTSGKLTKVVFQYTDNNYAEVSGSIENKEFNATEWTPVKETLTVNSISDRFLIDYSNYTGEVYIDNLKVVKVVKND